MFVTHSTLPLQASGHLSCKPAEITEVMVLKHDGKATGTGCFVLEWNSLGPRSELQKVGNVFNAITILTGWGKTMHRYGQNSPASFIRPHLGLWILPGIASSSLKTKASVDYS